MKNTIYILLFLHFIACESGLRSDHLDWQTINLPNGWTIEAPKGFQDTTYMGIDSEPGIIYSNVDSVLLEFDIGKHMIKQDNCDFQEILEKAQRDIASGFIKEFYDVPTKHKAYLDTINGLIATIIIPTIPGEGFIDIEISDCESGRWLGIRSKECSADKEKLILEIFNTIRLNNVP